MSSSKADRSVARSTSSRPSEAKHTNKDRNLAPPPPKYRPASKRKRRGASKISAAVAQPVVPPPADPPAEATAALVPSSGGDDPPPPQDPWWTPEREKAFDMTLQGVPQHQIADELGRERHTIARWTEDERFAQRLYEENGVRFKAMRQRRAMQTVRLTDRTEILATKMLKKATDLADAGKDDLGTRLAARDWLQEFREQSRREDEIYGITTQNVNVNVHGSVEHKHKGKVDVTFKTFLTSAMQKMGVDLDAEEIDAERADDALVAVAERALMEGSFLEEMVEREKQEALPALPAPSR